MRSIPSFLVATLLLSFVWSCGNNDEGSTDTSAEDISNKTVFYGKVTFVSHMETADSALAQSLKTFSPDSVDVYFKKDTFRMIEYGGLSHGNIVLYRQLQEAWQLDTVYKLAYLAEYSDLGDPSKALKDLMPDHFAPTVESTGEKETIAGIPCTKYRITRSGVIPKEDSAYIWAADRMVFPSSRYDVQSEINHAAVPPPLFIGYEAGAVMRLMVVNKKYTRTFEVSTLKENYFPEGIFDIPEGYQKK